MSRFKGNPVWDETVIALAPAPPTFHARQKGGGLPFGLDFVASARGAHPVAVATTDTAAIDL